ncbi:hypothetical protein LB507_011367 [Fusarium sp. FIESC RH6]|nr:hypothetical protein LB507_011367 [Fusarium sp. FIESC RH6]
MHFTFQIGTIYIFVKPATRDSQINKASMPTCGPCGLTFEDTQSLENHDCEIHHMCRQCLQRFTTAEELYMHSEVHGTPSEVVDDAIRRVLSLSKGAISESLATAILHDVIARTGGTIPHTRAARRAVPTTVEAQVAAPPVINTPVRIKAEARATTTTEPTNSSAEIQPEPSIPPVVAPPGQITKEQMKQHPQENEKNPDLQCFYCSWTTDDEDQLRTHNIFCNSETMHTWCDLCKKQYSSPRSYLQHIRDSPKHFTCDLCVEKMSRKGRGELERNAYTFQYVSWEALATHMRESHAACIPCNQWFVGYLELSDKKQLQNHNNTHHWSELCTACDLTFPDTRFLEEHKTTHPAEPIDCLGCSKTFGSYSLMMEHLESGNCKSGATHQFIKQSIKDRFKDPKGFDKDYKKLSEYFSFCPVCAKEFPRLSLLLQHYESRKCWKHGWQKLTPVKQMFYLRLKRAILAHIECVTCDTVFKDQRTRNEHMWNEHQERYCFLCKDDFSQKTWSTHFGNLQEACPEEGSWHGKREPKALPCKECGPDAIYGSDREFYNHCWKEHSTCAVCAVTYDNAEDLSKYDAKVHGKCGICGHLAKTYWDLRTHCKERHGIKLPLRPETPPESLKNLPEANLDRPILTEDSDPSRRPVKREEMSIEAGSQVEQKQGLITEWFNA